MLKTESDLHTAVNPQPRAVANEEDEYAIARQQFSMFMRAYDSGHRDYLELKDKCRRYYIGEQWDAADLTKLEAEGRPALTINMILSAVNVVLGEQIGRRVDMQFKPRKDASLSSAIALTKLSMAVNDTNQLQWKESQVFADGLIEERGFYDVRINFDKNIHGEIELTTPDPGDIIPDPDGSEYDPKSWREVYNARWMTLEEVEETYGEEYSKKLEGVAGIRDHFGKESIKRLKNKFGTTDDDEGAAYLMGSYDEETRKFITKVRVIERQFFKNTTVYSLVDMQTGTKRDLPLDTKKDEAAQVAQMFGAKVMKSIQRRVRWRVTADRFVLHDDWSIYKTFTYIPYFPYFRRGQPFGMVRNLLSPQEQLNKLSSQELHIVNTTANSGYIVEKGALHGMTVDDLREQGSKTGVVIEVAPGRMGGVEKIKPNTIPTGIDRITMKSQNNLKEISGVSNTMLGQQQGEVSGVALESQERRGQVQLQVPIDNLSLTRHLLARKMLELFQDFYTDERIVSYTNETAPGQPTEEMAINQMQEDGSITNDITMGDYDIVIGTLPSRDGFRDTQFAEALNLRNVGVQIPDYRVIQYSNLAHKDEVAEEVRQLSGLGEPSPEQAQYQQRQMEAEIGKLEAEVKEKLARAEELMSKSGLNSAKAEETTQSGDKKRMELEYGDTADQRSIALRERLATLSAINKLDVTELSARMKGDTK